MKLRFPVYFQQLLIAASSVFLLAATARGQQDAIIVTGGQQQQVKVVSVSGSALVVRTEAGDRPIPLAQISEVRMAEPPELAQALQAYQARDYGKALGFTKSVTDRFRGLTTSPNNWAQQASELMVVIQLALNDAAKAELEFAAFQKAYPTGTSLQMEVSAGRIAWAKKDAALAKQKINPVVDAALKDKNISATNARPYSQAFLTSGLIKEKDGDFSAALEDYLRTVTIFHHDRTAMAQAQERADALRAKHPEVTVP